MRDDTVAGPGLGHMYEFGRECGAALSEDKLDSILQLAVAMHLSVKK